MTIQDLINTSQEYTERINKLIKQKLITLSDEVDIDYQTELITVGDIVIGAFETTGFYEEDECNWETTSMSDY